MQALGLEHWTIFSDGNEFDDSLVAAVNPVLQVMSLLMMQPLRHYITITSTHAHIVVLEPKKTCRASWWLSARARVL